MRSEFEKAFPIPAHWIEFDEKANKYYCPYVADAKASEYQSMWKVWQHQQSKVDEIKKQKSLQEIEINHLGQANQAWQLKNDELQKRVDEANAIAQMCRDEKNHAINRWGAIRKELDAKDKQLIEQGQRFNEQSQRVKDLEHKNDELQKRVDSSLKIINNIQNNGLIFSQYSIEDIEQALKGGCDE